MDSRTHRLAFMSELFCVDSNASTAAGREITTPLQQWRVHILGRGRMAFASEH
jgi:hypothetical protein